MPFHAYGGGDDAFQIPGDRDLRRARIELSPKQRQDLQSLEREFKEESERLRDQIKRDRKELERQYRLYRMDENRVKSLHGEINRAQSRLLDRHLATQKRLRGILTESQFAALQDAIDDD